MWPVASALMCLLIYGNFIHPSVCTFICSSVHSPIHYCSIPPSLHPLLPFSLPSSIPPPSVHPPIPPSLPPYIHPSLSPTIFPSLSPSNCLECSKQGWSLSTSLIIPPHWSETQRTLHPGRVGVVGMWVLPPGWSCVWVETTGFWSQFGCRGLSSYLNGLIPAMFLIFLAVSTQSFKL